MLKISFAKFLFLGFIILFNGCSGGSDNSSAPLASSLETNSSTQGSDDNSSGMSSVGVSSDGIYLAESQENSINIYEIFTNPILYDSKVYMRTYRFADVDVDPAMKVQSYDLDLFTQDMNLSDLLANTLYEQEGPKFTSGHFNQRYYDIAEADGKLYFSTMPQNDALSQSSLIKYDISTNQELYHVQRDPINGKNLNTTFDLARGWFIPFDANQKIGIVEDAITKVIYSVDGAAYKISNTYDYFGSGATEGQYTDGKAPVSNATHYFYAFGNNLYRGAFLSDHTEYGKRDTDDDPEYLQTDILTDLNNNYNGSKNYSNISNTGTLILDNNDLYILASVEYDDINNTTQHDLYLLNYSDEAVFKNMKLLESSTSLYGSSIFDVHEPVLYNNVIYFTFRHDAKNELCGYSLINDEFTFRHTISEHPFMKDRSFEHYVITGNKIILPADIKRVVQADEVEDNYYYDMVFKVLDLDGNLEKTLYHKDLRDLKYSNHLVDVRASLSDASSVYFFAVRKNHPNYNHNLIVKIDTGTNSVQKDRYRFNANLNGILK